MAYGDISNSVIDSQAVTAFTVPEITHLDGGYAAVVGANVNLDSYLQTYHIQSNGNIDSGSLDNWCFDDTYGYPNIIHISGTKYLLSYGSNDSGTINSLDISNVGTITKSFIDALVMPGGTPHGLRQATLLHTSNVNDICFVSTKERRISSFTVDSDGNIGANIIDTLDHSVYGAATFANQVVNNSGNYYTTIYRDDIVTFSTDGSGNFTDVDTWDYTGVSAVASDIVKVPDSPIHIVAWNAVSHARLGTVSISDTGIIIKSFIDTLDLVASSLQWIRVYHLGGDYFAAVVRIGNIGKVYTFSCDSDGNLSDAVLDSLEFWDGADDHACLFPAMAHVQEDVYAVVFNESTTDGGYIRTFSIDVPGTGTSTIQSDANIYGTETSTIQSNSYIYETEINIIQSSAYVYKTETSTIQSSADIEGTETVTIQSDAHIFRDDETLTIQSDAEVILSRDTTTIQSNSHIYKIGISTIQSGARVHEKFYKDVVTIQSNSHVYKIGTSTIQSDAEVVYRDITTIQSDAHIHKFVAGTIYSNAHVYETFYKEVETVQSDAYVVFSRDAAIVQSDAHIFRDNETSTIQSDAGVYETGTDTIQSNTEVVYRDTTTIQSDADIGGITISTIYSNACVVKVGQTIPKKIQATMDNTDTSPQTGGRGDEEVKVLNTDAPSPQTGGRGSEEFRVLNPGTFPPPQTGGQNDGGFRIL